MKFVYSLWMLVILFIIVIPMFFIFEEMAILLPVNILIIGIAVILVYSVLTVIYKFASRKIFYVAVVIILSIPSFFLVSTITKGIYQHIEFEQQYKEMTVFSHAQTYVVGTDLFIHPTETHEKIILTIPKNGKMRVVFEPEKIRESIYLSLFNEEEKNVLPSLDGEIIIEHVKEGENYFLLIDHQVLMNQGIKEYVIKTLME